MKQKKRKTKIDNQPVTKSFIQQEMKELGGRRDGLEKQMKGFRNELSAHKISVDLKIDENQEETRNLIIGFKDEILRAVDCIMKELTIMREENIITTDMKRQLNDHEDRLEIVEVKVGISPLAA